jgi:hypothetical protein
MNNIFFFGKVYFLEEWSLLDELFDEVKLLRELLLSLLLERGIYYRIPMNK